MMTSAPEPRCPADPRGKVAPIVAAARALFLSQGYGATSMDAIAKAAPVSKRTLYHHFPSKEDLFGAVIAASWSHLAATPFAPDPSEDPRQALGAFARLLIDHWDHPDVVPLLRLILAEAPRFPELSAAYYRDGKSPAVEPLGRYFTHLAAAGRLKADDPQLAAAQFLGMIKEPLFWPRVLGVPMAFDTEFVIARAIDAVLAR